MQGGSEERGESTRRTTGRDRSLLLLGAVLVVAAPVLWHAGRHQWFFLDEWDFLLRRRLTQPGTLLVGWFGHNVALPAAAYRVLLAMWGTSSYRPYLGLAIAGHYAVVVAVWALARRLGVRGWIAVVAVLPLVCFGAGFANILFGFQITNTAALALSLSHFLLADRDGPWSRADTVGVLCGAAALLCSGVAFAGLAGVGASVLVRRGPRLAGAHTVPLAAGWMAWHFAASNRGQASTTRLDAGTVDFLISLPKATLGGLGGSELVALALGGLAVLGVAAATRAALAFEAGPARRRLLAPLVGCVVMPVAFGLLVAVQRLPGDQRGPTESRYVYVVGALVLPLLALGVEAVGRFRKPLVVVPLALLLAGLPANIRGLDQEEFGVEVRRRALALANSSQLATAPSRSAFLIFGVGSIDELRAVAALPGLPSDDEVPRAVQLWADVVLGLHPGTAGERGGCNPVQSDRRSLDPGDTIEFDGTVTVTALDGADRSEPVPFDDRAGSALTASGALQVEVVALGRSQVFVCPRA